jgi:hypothetical protein
MAELGPVLSSAAGLQATGTPQLLPAYPPEQRADVFWSVSTGPTRPALDQAEGEWDFEPPEWFDGIRAHDPAPPSGLLTQLVNLVRSARWLS